MKKKSIAWIVTGCIIVIIGAGGIAWSLRGGEETEYTQKEGIKEKELVLTEDNLRVNHGYMGISHQIAGTLGFEFNYNNVQVEAKVLGNNGCFKVDGDEKTQYVQQWDYKEQGKTVIDWKPFDLTKTEGDITELEEKSFREDHYISLTLREDTHIVGYVILKIPASDKNILEVVELETAVEFPKQDGQYQKVTEEYVEERIGKVMADKLS